MNWLNTHIYDKKNNIENSNNFDIEQNKWPSEEEKNTFRSKLEKEKNIQKEQQLTQIEKFKKLLDKENDWINYQYIIDEINNREGKAEKHINAIKSYNLNFENIEENETDKDIKISKQTLIIKEIKEEMENILLTLEETKKIQKDVELIYNNLWDNEKKELNNFKQKIQNKITRMNEVSIQEYKTEEITGLWTYIYKKKNQLASYSIETNWEWRMEFEMIWLKEFMIHAAIPNNKLIAGKSYKFLLDKIPSWSKMIEKTSLSWDSFVNLIKSYKKWDNSSYRFLHSWYVKLNQQGINSELSQTIWFDKENPSREKFYFTTIQHAEEIVEKIKKLIEGTDLPRPRIIETERNDGNFYIEIPNIILEKI